MADVTDPRAFPGRVRAVLLGALAAWTLVLAATLLAPSAAGPSWLVATVADAGARLGLPAALVDGSRVEFGLNVLAFVPLSAIGALAWTRTTWRDWTAVGFAASFTVEVLQALVLSARSATHADVVANTLGALLGALAGGLVLRVARNRSERGADLPDRHAATEQVQPPG